MNYKTIFLSFITLTIIAGSSLSAETGIDRVMEQTNSGIKTTTTGDKIENKKKQSNVYNYQEVVYERILENERDDNRLTQSKTDEKFAYSNKEAEQKRLMELAKKARKEIQKQKQKKEESKNFQFASGYCYVDNEIEIERLATYAYLSCDFQEPVGHATLAVSISPDFYAKALIGTPLYIEKGNKRLPVVSGAVLTRDKNSINIANVVNDRKIEKITTTGIYTATTVAAKEAQNYLAMKQQAATETQTDTIATTGGTTTVSATNTKEIPLDNYLVSGTIQLVSALSKVIGESIINDLPYTFKIYKDSVLFVDLQLSEKEKVVGFKTETKDGTLSVKEPHFTLDGTFEEPKQTKIKQRMDKK